MRNLTFSAIFFSLLSLGLASCSAESTSVEDDSYQESSTSKSPTSAALNSPAESFFNPGEAYITVTRVWGIPMDDENGPRPLVKVIVDMYEYLQNTTGGSPITEAEVERAFLPGRSLNSIFSRLVSDPFIYDLIYESFLEIARQKAVIE
jgi:hypothetical protein